LEAESLEEYGLVLNGPKVSSNRWSKGITGHRGRVGFGQHDPESVRAGLIEFMGRGAVAAGRSLNVTSPFGLI
jgi:hypothetical protein